MACFCVPEGRLECINVNILRCNLAPYIGTLVEFGCWMWTTACGVDGSLLAKDCFNLKMIRALSLCLMVVGSLAEMPLPFTRELELESPQMSGNDVIIYQNLIVRDSAVASIESTGSFDKATGKTPGRM
jgi:hypothetical protein